MRVCKLAFEDGTVFTGRAFGAHGQATGEAVFNTAMTGYQEVLTDPSYCGQIVTMTYPLIGNTGVNDQDCESSKLYLSGMVIKELSLVPSHYKATSTLDSYLKENGVIGLAGVDTRAITRRLRECGSLRAILSTEDTCDSALCDRARSLPPMSGQNLAERVAGAAPVRWNSQSNLARKHRVVVLDCGIKYNILRRLDELDCEVISESGLSSAEKILEHRPEGIVIGNGPGDPSAVTAAIKTISGLLGKVPIFGICLGHQLLASAMGAKIYKLKFGHHGVNHPVRNLATGKIEITSQNHGFAVDAASLPQVGGIATHVNLNDESLEGLAHRSHAAFAVQYHPEAAPGPHDSGYLFQSFIHMIETGKIPDELMPS